MHRVVCGVENLCIGEDELHVDCPFLQKPHGEDEARYRRAATANWGFEVRTGLKETRVCHLHGFVLVVAQFGLGTR